MNHTSVKVTELPDCNFCGKLALYDAKTINRFWAYMCASCFKYYGIGLGLGKGQKLEIYNEEKLK